MSKTDLFSLPRPSQDSDEDAIRTAASAIRDKKANIRMLNQQKNKLQNRPIIPRTVQHRTLSEMTSKLAEAGYNTNNLEDRAKVLAKARGLIGSKRSAGDMDVDDEDDEEAWGEDDEEMDVEDGSSRKKQKTSTSAVGKGKRVPKSDRQIAGLGDAEVSSSFSRSCDRTLIIPIVPVCSKQPRPFVFASSTNVHPTGWPRPPSLIGTFASSCRSISTLVSRNIAYPPRTCR